MRFQRRGLLLGAASLLFFGLAMRKRTLVVMRAIEGDKTVADVLRRAGARVQLGTSRDEVSDLYVAAVDGKPVGLDDETRHYFVECNFDWPRGALLSTQQVTCDDIVTVGICSA